MARANLLENPMSGSDNRTLIEVEALAKYFPVGRRRTLVQAVNGISFSVGRGEIVGLVGESGCGKSTVGRCLLRLVEPTSGRLVFDRVEITGLSWAQLLPFRARMQMVFQDPYGSLNPRMRVEEVIAEPLRLHTNLDRRGRERRVSELLDLVLLGPRFLRRLPRELSGGEAQRVGIARAIATNPDFLVLDEPTSSLDFSARTGILSLLLRLRDELSLTYLLISHDLYSIGAYCDRVMVMYLGLLVEVGPTQSVFDSPQHPYTQALLSARLPADPEVRLARHILRGEVPSAIDVPKGCVFASRCPLVRDDCLPVQPPPSVVGSGHTAACVRISDGTNLLDLARP